MKRIVGQVCQMPFGLLPSVRCEADDGTLDDAATQTLLDLIEQSWPVIHELLALLAHAEKGEYKSPNVARPDWSANDICLWLGPEHIQAGTFGVTNENTQYSHDGTGEQVFSYKQFHQALAACKEFKSVLANSQLEALLGKEFHYPFASKPGA